MAEVTSGAGAGAPMGQCNVPSGAGAGAAVETPRCIDLGASIFGFDGCCSYIFGFGGRCKRSFGFGGRVSELMITKSC